VKVLDGDSPDFIRWEVKSNDFYSIDRSYSWQLALHTNDKKL
jgi:hypothetical protein